MNCEPKIFHLKYGKFQQYQGKSMDGQVIELLCEKDVSNFSRSFTRLPTICQKFSKITPKI